MFKWIMLIVALVLNAAANILLKVGAVTGQETSAGPTFWAKLLHFLNLATVAGIALFAANVLVYRRALDDLNVSVAYPVMVSGGLIIVTLAAAALPALREKITWLQVAGMVLIAAGVWLVALQPES